MVKKKKKSAPATKKRQVVPAEQKSSLLGLNRSQTRSLALGAIVAGVALFALAGVSYKNMQEKNGNILPEAASTMLSKLEITPTPTGNQANQAQPTPSTQPEVTSTEVTDTPTPTEQVTDNPMPSETVAAPTQTPAQTDGKTISKLPKTSSKVTYTIEENDSLATIGVKLCDSDTAWVSIAQTNELTNPDAIYPGGKLIITCN